MSRLPRLAICGPGQRRGKGCYTSLNPRKSQGKCYYECKSDVPPCTSPAECISSITAVATFLARSARSRWLPLALPSQPKDIPCTLGPASGKTRHRCVPLGPSTVKESVIVWILFRAALCVESINASSLGEIDSSAISSLAWRIRSQNELSMRPKFQMQSRVQARP